MLMSGPQMPRPPIPIAVPPLAPPFLQSAVDHPSLAVAAASFAMRDAIEASRRRSALHHADSESDLIDSSATASDQQLMIEDPSGTGRTGDNGWKAAVAAAGLRSPLMLGYASTDLLLLWSLLSFYSASLTLICSR